MRREFTASVYLFDNQKVLLLHHPKLQKWLPPGGHVEPNETPPEAARREVLEETGLEFEFYLDENLSIDYWNARSLERPYLCLLENIPAHGNSQAHQHIDFVYVGKPTRSLGNSFSYHWFDWEELMNLQPESEIFQETLDVLKHLYNRLYSEVKAC